MTSFWLNYRERNKNRRALSDDQIREIRRRHAKGDRLVDIQKDIPVSSGAYHKIVNRLSYKDIADA